MGKQLNKTDYCCLKTIGIRQLPAEISLGLREPLTIEAGKIYGGRLGKELEQLYRIKRKNILEKGQKCGKT